MFTEILAPTHIALILIVALLVLGPKRLPEVGKSLGKGLRDFKEAMSTYSPEGLLNDDPSVHATTAADSDLRRQAPAAASATNGPAESAAPAHVPNEPTIDAEPVEDGSVTDHAAS